MRIDKHIAHLTTENAKLRRELKKLRKMKGVEENNMTLSSHAEGR